LVYFTFAAAHSLTMPAPTSERKGVTVSIDMKDVTFGCAGLLNFGVATGFQWISFATRKRKTCTGTYACAVTSLNEIRNPYCEILAHVQLPGKSKLYGWYAGIASVDTIMNMTSELVAGFEPNSKFAKDMSTVTLHVGSKSFTLRPMQAGV
jgi:hypothetical protein